MYFRIEKQVVFIEQSSIFSYNPAFKTLQNVIIKAAESVSLLSPAQLQQRVECVLQDWARFGIAVMTPGVKVCRSRYDPPSAVQSFDLFICSEFTACEIVSVNSTEWDVVQSSAGGQVEQWSPLHGRRKMDLCAYQRLQLVYAFLLSDTPHSRRRV